MKISTEVKRGILTIRLAGEFDMASAETFRQTVDEALDASGTRNILLDMRQVTFVDSSGLGAIIGRYKRVLALGGRVAACSLQPQVARILEMSGLFRIISRHTTEAEALHQF